MLAEKLKKSAFKHVEGEMFSYHETKKEIMRLRNDILYAGNLIDDNIGASRPSTPGDPTCRKATMLTDHRKLKHLESIAQAVETVYNRLPEHKKKLIHMYYWTSPQLLTWDGIAQKLHVSRRQAINWRNEAIAAIGDMMGWR